MKIIQVHNYYQQAGGEDAVVAAELSLLRAHGHEAVTYYKNNSEIVASSNKLLAVSSLLKASFQTIWNWKTYAEFRKLLQSEKPDIVHCHNTFPLISPSIYWACAKENVPVVQTLHNYRLLCLNAFLFREKRSRHADTLATKNTKQYEVETHCASASLREKKENSGVCELCVSRRFKWPGIKYSCYRDSTAGSFVVATMLFIHKLIGTWSKKVTAYIALTEFQKQKMIEEGLPEDKIWVKPNFIQTTEYADDAEEIFATKDRIETQGESDFNNLNDIERLTRDTPYALFVGRLSPEKGCDVLLKAWGIYREKLTANSLQPTGTEPSSTSNDRPSTNYVKRPCLLIVGDGPERETLEELANSCKLSAVSFLGRKPKNEVLSLMHNAQFLISPSVCYETFGLVVLEAGMLKTPSLVAEPGTIAGLIDDDKTGLLFPMGDAQQLADKIAWGFGHPVEMKAMGEAARRSFESKYSAGTNYRMLMDVYESVLRVKCSSYADTSADK